VRKLLSLWCFFRTFSFAHASLSNSESLLHRNIEIILHVIQSMRLIINFRARKYAFSFHCFGAKEPALLHLTLLAKRRKDLCNYSKCAHRRRNLRRNLGRSSRILHYTTYAYIKLTSGSFLNSFISHIAQILPSSNFLLSSGNFSELITHFQEREFC